MRQVNGSEYYTMVVTTDAVIDDLYISRSADSTMEEALRLVKELIKKELDDITRVYMCNYCRHMFMAKIEPECPGCSARDYIILEGEQDDIS